MIKKKTDDLRGRRNCNSQDEHKDVLATWEFSSQAAGPLIKKTTSSKLVSRGVIVSYGPIKGLYYLNKSRERMKLPPLDVSRVRAQMQAGASAKRDRGLLFAAMATLVKETVIVFSGETMPKDVTPQEAQYVADLVVQHSRKLDGSSAPVPDRFAVNSELSEITQIEDPIQRVADIRAALDSLSIGITNYINQMNRKSLYRLEACLKYLQQYPLGSLFFLTLTTLDKDSAQSKLKRKMPSLITNLLGRKNILYVKVVETDQRGRVHWHFILVLPWDAEPEIVARHLIDTAAGQWETERKHYNGRIRELSRQYRASMKQYGVGRFNMTPVINLEKIINYMTKCKYEGSGTLPGGMRRWSCSKQLKAIHGDFAFVSARARAQRLLTALIAFSKGCLDLDEIRSRYGRSWWYFEIRPDTELILEMIAERRQMDLIYYLIPGRQENPEGTTNRMIVQLHRRAFKDLLCLLDTYPTAQWRGVGA